MTTDLTAIDVALNDLTPHELNARANSPDAYESDDIANLAASIRTLGLLNPLIVQKTGKKWGVLAGGRRLAALRRLAEDKAAKGWTLRTKIMCRVMAEDIAAATAITLAENLTQKPMDPIDEYEAFARMMEVGGHDPDSIARTFGVDRRRVVERLRFGRIHPDIRQAARDGRISLDTMKAFAGNSDQSVQKATFDALSGQHMQAWTVRDRLEARGTRLGDDVARFVLDEYKAAGGEIVADLIEEDSTLADAELMEMLLLEKLAVRAEVERKRLGFAWSEARREMNFMDIQDYGRVYPGTIEPSEADAERCVVIEARLTEIEDAYEDSDDPDALEAENERLTEEYEMLTTGWAERDLASAGVIAWWKDGEIAMVAGLVRPEDRRNRSGEATSGGSPDASTGAKDDALTLSESLRVDLRSERATVIGTALAGNPSLAHDLLLFKTAADILGRFGGVSYALEVKAGVAARPHGKPDGVDGEPARELERLHAGLDLTWWHEGKSMPERFEAFRDLDADMKSRIVAVALAATVQPSGLGHGEQLLTSIARQIVPDLRAVWRPTGEAFFARLNKSALLGIIARDLRQPEEATRLATGKKAAVVDFLERLFAAPFATLTAEQREAVETWCPPGMEIPEPVATSDRHDPRDDDDSDDERDDESEADPEEEEIAAEPADVENA